MLSVQPPVFFINSRFFSVIRFVIPIFLLMLPSFCMADRCSDKLIYTALEDSFKDDKPQYGTCMVNNFHVNNVAKLLKFDTPCFILTLYNVERSEAFYKITVSECHPQETAIMPIVICFLLGFIKVVQLID